MNEIKLESWQIRCHSQPDGRPTLCSFDCRSSIYDSFFNFSIRVCDCLQPMTQCISMTGHTDENNTEAEILSPPLNSAIPISCKMGHFGDRWSLVTFWASFPCPFIHPVRNLLSPSFSAASISYKGTEILAKAYNTTAKIALQCL